MTLSPDLSRFSLYTIKGKKKNNPDYLKNIYDDVFKAWHETWEQTYTQDFHSTKKLASDDFTRQDEIMAIFYDNKCAALCFFSSVDMKDRTSVLDSYFQCWPNSAISGLTAEGNNILVCSQFTVCEGFRKTGAIELENTPWKIILIALLSKYFLESNTNAMTGNTRVNKGVEKLTYQFGAIPLVERMEYQAGADTTYVDLVTFFKNNVYQAYYHFAYAPLLDKIWGKRNNVDSDLKIAA